MEHEKVTISMDIVRDMIKEIDIRLIPQLHDLDDYSEKQGIYRIGDYGYVPEKVYKQYKEQKKAIWHNPELDGYGILKAQADLKSAYGKLVVEQGYASVHDPARFAAFLDKEAACKKADIIDRCNAKAGGIDEVEWTYIGPDGRINGIISGPKGRFSIKSIFAGGYNIQCLHVRVLVHKLK